MAKKASFVRQVAAELALRNLRAEHARVEQLQLPPVRRGGVARLRLAGRLQPADAPATWLPGGCWLAMKGKLPDGRDRRAAVPTSTVFHVERLQVPGLDAQRCLVWMRPS